MNRWLENKTKHLWPRLLVFLHCRQQHYIDFILLHKKSSQAEQLKTPHIMASQFWAWKDPEDSSSISAG